MVNAEILGFIRGQLNAGQSREKIKSDLLSGGWTDADVNEAFASMSPQNAVPPPQNLAPTPQNIASTIPHSVASIMGPTPTTQKSSKTVPIIITVIVLLLLAGGGVFAYKFYQEKSVQSLTINESATQAINEPASSITDESALSSPEELQEPLQCATSECFANAIQNCSTAYYQTDSDVEFLGAEIKSKIDFYLAQSDNSCLLNLTLLSYNISPSQGLLDSSKGAQIVGPSIEEIYSKLNADAQSSVGKKGTCDITNEKDMISSLFNNNSGANEEKLVINLSNTNSSILLIITPDYDICSGDVFPEFVVGEN